MEDASCAEQGLQPGFCDKGMLSTMLSASLLIGHAGSEFVPLRDAPCLPGHMVERHLSL